jgi:PAS domain S-box-containing protein
MQSGRGTAPSEFIAAFAQQRRRLLHHAGSLLTAADSASRPADTVPKLTRCLAASLEELKVAEEELFNQQLRNEVAQNEQARRLAYFRALFHHAPTPLFLTTTDGSIRAVNRAAAELVTRDVYGLEGKPITALVPQASRPEFRRQLSLLAQTGGASKLCFTLLRQTDVPLRVEAAVQLMPPEVVGARAFYWNVRPVEDPSNLERVSERY